MQLTMRKARCASMRQAGVTRTGRPLLSQRNLRPDRDLFLHIRLAGR